jgi:hypothetical protein
MGLHEKEFEIRVERVGHQPTPTSARSRPNAFGDKRLIIVEYEYLTSLVSDVFLTLTGIDIRL